MLSPRLLTSLPCTLFVVVFLIVTVATTTTRLKYDGADVDNNDE
jgi:hypothetical protein